MALPRRSLRLCSLALLAAACAAAACGPRGPAKDAPRLDPAPLEAYPRYEDPEAAVFNDLPVRLYFYVQSPPEGIEVLRPIRVRAAAPAGPGGCRDAAMRGLVRVQRLAARHDVDAVVNLRPTWNGEPLGDELRYGCRLVRDRYALIWEGALARLPAALPSPAPAAAGDPGGKDDAGARLRELQRLYYQGLITREELERRRRAVLDEISPEAPAPLDAGAP